MTIRRRWTTRVPILGWEIERSRILKPGYVERIVVRRLDWSQESDSLDDYPKTLIVDQSDSVILMPRVTVDARTLPYGGRSFGGKNDPWNLREKYRREEVNHIVDSEQGEEIRTRYGLVISNGRPIRIQYEPTLPAQARK